MSLFTNTEEQITENYEKFMAYVKADARADQLIAMYEAYGNELATAPASGRTHFHNAFVGGYLDHIVRVAETSLKLAALYKEIGGDINFTKQELIFAALHHDLGKLGHPEDGPYYIEQDSDWHRKRGELYKHNEILQYFKVPDRSVFVLQQYGIQLTQAEWLAIKLSDGLYDESTKSYLTTFTPYAMKTNLPSIIHSADKMASSAETDKSRF